MAISARYDNYKTLEGGNPGARDIAVGANGSIWAIGSEPFGDGYRVLRYDGLHWSGTQGGAVRVAVAPDGTPWVVTATGWIFHAASDSAGTTWGSPLPTNSPGIASDIGVGYNGDVWVIGGACGRPDCPIYKWNPANGGSWVADQSGGAAVRITVGHTGVPWVLNSAKNFYRYTTNDPMTGTWQKMPGLSDDLAIGPGDPSLAASGTTQIDYTWSIGRLNSGLVSLEVWDEQATNNEGSPHPINPFAWVGQVQACSFDSTSAVAVGPRGEPYIVCNGGQIITPFR